VIFGGTAATGSYAQTADEFNTDLTPIDPAIVDDLPDNTEEQEEPQEDDQVTESSFQSNILTTTIPLKRAASVPIAPRAKKAKNTMIGAINDLVTIVKDKQSQSSYSTPLTIALRTLQSAYPKLSDRKFLDAVKMIKKDVETFNALTGKRRDAWLEAMIGELEIE
jgi:hypothetical protein